MQAHVKAAISRAGLISDHPPIVAFAANSANPHYEPRESADRVLESGDVVLLDLWAAAGPRAVMADQTWMGFAGQAVDPLVQEVWKSVRAARDAVVIRLRESWHTGLTGADLDDTARTVIRVAGFGEYFTHRTGHSIDRELQGSGPHLDNFETSDERALVPGVGFSVEPGIYLPGRFGVRSEINVFLHETGPEVTPVVPQDSLLLI
jgi:Xaa-Pro aminopeptidase